jgi:hypothetical protein
MKKAYGEAAVSLTLLLGFCIGLTALIGLFLSLNYGLATQWMSFGQQGFHVLLITAMIIFLGARGACVGAGWPDPPEGVAEQSALAQYHHGPHRLSALATLCRYRFSSLPWPLQSSSTTPQGRGPTCMVALT